ncbi:hypothetical protein [Staphylococcus haemolyticus]|uniref:hypothetical protein n=1 Tax=Staphylococcus haemolyticus TaxID=1283 RepID=UPI000E3E3D5C|nr:hypothetical protein [Staphylococcus haemolyticus]RFT91682.1 hypothetical protein DT249_12310 [Staphylococcus haemolyticus]RFU00646.1 hypothetical protein DT248_12295 [Staphylococcus haemolyticus]
MAKVKKKVEMTLPELIEWAWKNGVKEKAFYSNLDGGSVYFDKIQNLSIEHEIAINETFTVEVEEEITEDTKLDTVLEIYNDKHHPGSVSSVIQKNTSINNIMEYNPSYFNTECLYLVNEDMTLTLVWKDGELVGDE